MYTGSFVRCLSKESSNFPLPNGIIPGIPKSREGPGSFNESLIGVEPSSRAGLVVTMKKEFFEEFFGKYVRDVVAARRWRRQWWRRWCWGGRGWWRGRLRTLALAMVWGTVRISGATKSICAAAHPLWAWCTPIPTIWGFILMSSKEGEK